MDMNSTVRIGVMFQAPYVMPCYYGEIEKTDPYCRIAGLSIDLIRNICSISRLKCEIIKENHTDFGDNANGSWRGMIRQIMDGQYQTSLHSFNPTETRRNAVDFARSMIGGSNLYIITRFPDKSVLSPGAIFGFHWSVWALILVSVLVIAILGTAFEGIKADEKLNKLVLNSFYQAFVLGVVMFQQGNDGKRFNWIATYIAFGIWGLCCVVLVGLYSSYILNSALAVRYRVPFSDLSSLASCIYQGKCLLVTRSLSQSYFDRIFNSVSGPYHDMKLALDRNPPQLVNGSTLPYLLDRTSKVFQVTISSKAQFSYFVQRSEQCSLEGVPIAGYDLESFPFNKGNDALRNAFSEAIERLEESGVLNRLLSQYIGNYIEIQESCKEKTVESEAMRLETFQGAFLAVVIGAAVAGILLLIEQCHSRIRKKRD